jgi:transposase
MDRLFALVDSELHLDPRSGTLFVFFNRNRSLAKVAYYDGSGSCLFYKRLEKACSNIQMSMKTEAPVKSRRPSWHCFWKAEI